MEIVKEPEAQDVQTNDVVQQETTADTQEQMKQEYLAYIAEIEAGRFSYSTQQETVDSVNALCKVLSLTTVVPRTELQNNKEGQRVPVIIGGTHIDLVKSQYPGMYPVLIQRLLDLTGKL
jgi:hypothetical protein